MDQRQQPQQRYNLSKKERECLPQQAQNYQELEKTLQEPEINPQRLMDIMNCLSIETITQLATDDQSQKGQESLSADTYLCSLGAFRALERMQPEATDTPINREENLQKAATITTALMMGSLTVMQYCMTDDEWHNADPDSSPEDRQALSCFIERLGGPGEFLLVLADLDNQRTEAELKQAQEECQADAPPAAPRQPTENQDTGRER